MLNSRLYDALKYVAQILLPAVGALYFGLAQVWGLANGEEVVGTITVVDAFLGVLLGISSIQYNNSEKKYDGSIDVVDTGTKKTFSLTLDGDPNEIDEKDEVLFKINKAS